MTWNNHKKSYARFYLILFVCSPAKCFYITSLLSGKVLDVKRDKAVPGAKVIMYEKKGGVMANQLWYEDERGIIRTKLNGFVLDSSS